MKGKHRPTSKELRITANFCLTSFLSLSKPKTDESSVRVVPVAASVRIARANLSPSGDMRKFSCELEATRWKGNN